jgi:hypothetical protein
MHVMTTSPLALTTRRRNSVNLNDYALASNSMSPKIHLDDGIAWTLPDVMTMLIAKYEVRFFMILLILDETSA